MSSKQRRSGRIPRRLPIVLLGSDTSGRVFSEETVTLVLSRHGAGVLSRHKLAPDETLSVRLPGASREVEVRLVGHLGQQEDGYVYGLEFRDPDVDLWGVDFPPAMPVPDELIHPTLECELCKARCRVENGDIQEDVYAVNESVLRFCERCGVTTSWRRASPERPPDSESPKVANSPRALDMVREPVPVPVLAVSGEDAVSETADHRVAAATAQPSGRRGNRRKHVRTRVSFLACVRFHGSDDVVECDNISKGGLCFRSRRHYPVNESIEVAAPFSEGEQPIFASGQIRRVEELPAGLFRYGVEYGAAPKVTCYV